MLSEGHQFVLPSPSAGQEGAAWHLWVASVALTLSAAFHLRSINRFASGSQHARHPQHPLSFPTPHAPDWPALVSQLQELQDLGDRGRVGPWWPLPFPSLCLILVCPPHPASLAIKTLSAQPFCLLPSSVPTRVCERRPSELSPPTSGSEKEEPRTRYCTSSLFCSSVQV